MGGGGNYHRDVPTREEESSFTRERVFNTQAYRPDPKKPDRRVIHPILDAKGKIRECCDSNVLPETTPIVIAMDVTRSRGEDAVTIYKKIPGFIGRLKMTGVVKQPVIGWCAIGDATFGDQAPIQISQFESDEKVDEALSKIWLEEGGGGTGQESYELAAYYYARRVKLDCLRRGKKGYMFILGDEGFYPQISADQVRVFIGDALNQDVPSAQIFQELQKNFEVFFIFPKKKWEDKKGDIDEEMKTRVRNAGGMVEGVSIRATLLWNNRNDLDLHVQDPCGHHIYYGSYCKNNGKGPAPCDGWLDVDMNFRQELLTSKPVENIRWEKGKAPKGHYKVWVNFYGRHEPERKPTEWRAEIEIDGKLHHCEGIFNGDEASFDQPIMEFDYDGKGVVEDRDKYKLYKDEVILGQWGRVLPPERILVIKDPKACIDAMLGAIMLKEGKQTLDEYLVYLQKTVGQTDERLADVRQALEKLANMGGGKENVAGGLFPAKKGGGKKKSARI